MGPRSVSASQRENARGEFDPYPENADLACRSHLSNEVRDWETCLRRSLKAFAPTIGTTTRRSFEVRASELIGGEGSLWAIMGPLLSGRRIMLDEFERLDRLRRQLALHDPICERLTSVPDVRVVEAPTCGASMRLNDSSDRKASVLNLA
jgi:hypothetical protein